MKAIPEHPGTDSARLNKPRRQGNRILILLPSSFPRKRESTVGKGL